MKIKIVKSPNYTIRNTTNKKIKFIVLHYTGMQSERVSIERLINKNSQVSSHYLINRKGEIIKMIDENILLGMRENQNGKILLISTINL